MTLEEHVSALRAALEAARGDGYLIDFDFEYTEWWGDLQVSSLEVSLYRNKRGADGIMRVEERSAFLTKDV